MYTTLESNTFTTEDWIKVAPPGIVSQQPMFGCAAVGLAEMPVLDEQATSGGELILVPSKDQFEANQQPSVTQPTRAAAIEDAINAVVANARESKPQASAIRSAVNLIAAIPEGLLGDPDVDAFSGEVHLNWEKDARQVVVMSLANREPLVHHYRRIKGSPSEHGIEKATAESLVRWLVWLNG